MEKFTLKVKLLRNQGNSLPGYMTPHGAGMDLFAAIDSELVLDPGERALVPTGSPCPSPMDTKPRYDHAAALHCIRALH